MVQAPAGAVRHRTAL